MAGYPGTDSRWATLELSRVLVIVNFILPASTDPDYLFYDSAFRSL